jgi:hypothetical protein
MLIMRNALAALTLSAAMIASLPAQADLLRVSTYPEFRNIEFTNIGTAASVPEMREFGAALLGIRNLDVSPATILPAYCVEPDQFLSEAAIGSGGEQYTARANTNTAVQNLFNAFFYDSLTSVAKSAGFQLALWEIVYDDQLPINPTGRLAFKPKDFERDGYAAWIYAIRYLNTYADFEGESLQLVWWQSEVSQDLIQVLSPTVTNPVPLPGALVLMGSALAASLRFHKARKPK